MTQPLTAMERRVYEYLLDFTAENTFQPSIREIGKRFRIKSTKTVSDILQALAAKGYIERDASRSRGVRLLGFGGMARSMPVPYFGGVHAGEPALLPERREGYVTIDRRFVPSETTFMLRVVGDSMTGRGVLDGDFVLVNPSATAAHGDMVALRLGEGTAIKTLVEEDGRTIFRAAAPGEPDLEVTPTTDCTVLGVVCGVFRPFYDAGTAIEVPAEQEVA
ncbi:MAG TPA: transcriptional repressor LexA [Gemmatimonadaceae bacterium]|jgi:repressor LexA|nr:transcriptional repressor LexA [Gemmatimonadaceae bacterium]